MALAENTKSSRIIHAEITPGKQGVSTLPTQITSDDSGKSPFISVQPETGKQGVSTLPIRITDDSPKDSRCLLPKQTGMYYNMSDFVLSQDDLKN